MQALSCSRKLKNMATIVCKLLDHLVFLKSTIIKLIKYIAELEIGLIKKQI